MAKSITSKYIKIPANDVREDLIENHSLKLSQSYIQNLTFVVGKISENIEIEYKLPKIEKDVACVGIGVDGTCSYVGDNGWRETMVGTISLYDKEGNRLHTTYISHAPEYGKKLFKQEMTKEIEKIKRVVPKSAKFVGIADGALENWSFLKPHIECEILDFFHVSEYLAKSSKVVNLRNDKEQKKWLNDACHSLKNNENAALVLLDEMKNLQSKQKVPKKAKEDLQSAITYFNNHHHQMNYSRAIKNNIPIGSGVTESACKVLVKQRLCVSGAKWSHSGAKHMLDLRAINLTEGRWEQLWNKIAA